MKIKPRYDRIGMLLFFLLAAVCLFCVVQQSIQATLPLPSHQSFVGEYSRDGVHWAPLDDRADLSVQGGDLYLRGHFTQNISANGSLYFYRDHIGVSIYRDGVLLCQDTISYFREDGIALLPSLCGRQWSSADLPDLTPADEIEIRLVNPHQHGSRDAYRTFLNTLYSSSRSSIILESYLKPYSVPLQIVGVVLIIAALMLLGAALASGVLRIPIGGVWRYGLTALFLGGFTVLDTVNICFISRIVVFNTYGRQLCLMLAVFCAGLCLCGKLSGRARTVAAAAMRLSALVDSVLIALSFTGVMVIYDTGVYWAASQAVLCPLLIGCAAVEGRGREKSGRIALFALACIQIAVLLDLAGVGESIYSHGTCTKVVFVLLSVCYAADIAKHIVIDHQASIRAKQLEEELVDSRIAITLSQIQPHFLYNSLSAIAALCQDSPAAAQAVDDFATYLRGNMATLTFRGLVRFSVELRHIEAYLRLEKLRFGELLQIEYDIETEDFLLPALTVQPLVENAVKHGACQKPGGGRVILRTRRDAGGVTITVTDDGVGFDPTRPPADGCAHVGIQNVRTRLQQMANGELTIESAPGVGTTATIRLSEAGCVERSTR